MHGVVERFDGDGWGTIESHDERGAATRHRFHSTAISDGSRMIDVGTLVTFELVPGRQGRWEATQVRDAHGDDADADRPVS